MVQPRRKPPYRKTPKKMGPLWDWTKGITQSGLTQFMACREQFALGYVDGWTPRSFSASLEFGSVIHFMLERKGTASPESIAREVCRSYDSTRKKTIDPTSYNDLQKSLVAAEALFPHYCRVWEAEDSKLAWLKREQIFEYTHHFKDYDGILKPVKLRGMRDGEYRNSIGQLGLFETKTKSQIDDVAIKSGLRADLQTMMYLLAMENEYHEQPTEILYNVIRRPQLVQGKNEAIDAYGKRISEDIKKRPEWYFRRFLATVLPEDTKIFVETSLDPVLRQFFQWWGSIAENPTERWTSLYHYRSLPALMTRYGKAPLYDLMILGKTAGYFRRSSPFPELEQSLQTAEVA